MPDHTAEHLPTRCRICASAAIRVFDAREMMFGTREVFQYFECTDCGCVQILSYPGDIARQYPKEYYCGVADCTDRGATKLDIVKDRLKSLLLQIPPVRAAWLRSSATKAWLKGKPLMQHYLDALDNPSARILDVGCGEGLYIQHLRMLGFRNAEGVDPFIAESLTYRGRLLVTKGGLADMRGPYDCISFHHSLEHMPDQAEVLRRAKNMLSPDGVLLIRIPIAGTAAWCTYKQDWVQLDPPRHYYCHSKRSLSLLSEQCGLHVRSMVCDSEGFQFWASELYVRDVPLTDPRSPRMGSRTIFTDEDLDGFDRRAADLNRKGEGDQIVAILAAAK